MRSLILLAILGLLMAMAGAALAKGPRLGSFKGAMTGTVTYGGREIPGGPMEGVVKVSLRPKLGRLYVNMLGKPQSLRLVSDTVDLLGDRVITYVRPSDSSRSGKFNLRKFNDDPSAARHTSFAGQGTLVVTKEGRLHWTNTGTGMIELAGTPERAWGWNERFDGARPANPR
jgi:hypothetical protein